MNRTALRRRALVPAAGLAAVALALTACGGNNDNGGGGGSLSGSVDIDGSSTVGPMTQVAAEMFYADNPDVQITVGESGTGGGFEKFCAGETDQNDASRPIEDDEAAACDQAGVTYQEMVVANDAITLVVNKENTWATCLTTEQLKKIWEPKSTVTTWNQVDPSFPDEKLVLFGPDTDSGTFDYFTASINGEEGASRTDYSPSSNDNNTVQGVQGTKGGLGYFGYSYYEANADTLNAVQVDSGSGCVAPSAETVQDASYAPLSRPLFIYPSVEKGMDNDALVAFVQYYVANIDDIAAQAAFVPPSADQKTTLEGELADYESAVGASS